MEQEIDYEEWEIAGGMFASLIDVLTKTPSERGGLRLNDWREAKRNLNSPNLDTTPT